MIIFTLTFLYFRITWTHYIAFFPADQLHQRNYISFCISRPARHSKKGWNSWNVFTTLLCFHSFSETSGVHNSWSGTIYNIPSDGELLSLFCHIFPENMYYCILFDISKLTSHPLGFDQSKKQTSLVPTRSSSNMLLHFLIEKYTCLPGNDAVFQAEFIALKS